MINISLFKQSLKSNYKIILGFMIIMAIYFTIIVQMFDPNNTENLKAMFESLPKEMLEAFGFSSISTNLIEFVASYYYGFIAIVFPMIFSIVVGNRLIAKHVDSGSMAYFLSTPNKRSKIVITQGMFLVISITAIMFFITSFGVLVSNMIHPELLDVEKFITLNIVAWLLQLVIGGICFMASCIFNESKYSLMFGAGIPIGFFIIQMLSNVSDKLEWLKSFTIMTLLDIEKITSGESIMLNITVMLGIIVGLYGVAIIVFNKKDLPI